MSVGSVHEYMAKNKINRRFTNLHVEMDEIRATNQRTKGKPQKR